MVGPPEFRPWAPPLTIGARTVFLPSAARGRLRSFAGLATTEQDCSPSVEIGATAFAPDGCGPVVGAGGLADVGGLLQLGKAGVDTEGVEEEMEKLVDVCEVTSLEYWDDDDGAEEAYS